MKDGGRRPYGASEAVAGGETAGGSPGDAAALRVVDGRILADLAFTHPVPQAKRAGHTVALGIDWGLNTLLSAGACRLNADGSIIALGAGAQYQAHIVLAKTHRLRRQGEALHAKLDCYQRLTAGDETHSLTAKAEVLADEAVRVADGRSHLNDALAWSAARWGADQAIAAGATVIYVEDLRSMEARGMGRTLNTRLSQTVRGKIIERLRHIAAEHGIAVVTVPPRGTSKNCPRCLTPLRHCKAPDQPAAPGWKWARCPGCGWQGDRDHGAWQRIAARGLTHQAVTTIQRGTLPAALTPLRPASGGTRDTGPAPAAPRSNPGPAREHDLHGPRQAPPPGTRGGTRRRLPPARPRHPAPTGTRPPAPSRNTG